VRRDLLDKVERFADKIRSGGKPGPVTGSAAALAKPGVVPKAAPAAPEKK